MPVRLSLIIFVVVLAVAGGFVVSTSQALPDPVASHFASSGQANAFMSRSAYVRFMLAFTVGLPLVLGVSMALVFRYTNKLNLPNRDYWLAPERRAGTVSFLTGHALLLADGLAIFLCYVHRLVVQANAGQPARLASDSMIAGLVILLVATLLWTVWLLLAFRAPRMR